LDLLARPGRVREPDLLRHRSPVPGPSPARRLRAAHRGDRPVLRWAPAPGPQLPKPGGARRRRAFPLLQARRLPRLACRQRPYGRRQNVDPGDPAPVKPPPKLYDGQGRPLLLGRLIGKGGEGSVYELTSGDLVVKLYHGPIGPERAEKIQAMVRLKTEALLKVAAWPVDTVHRRPGSEAAGLLMPKISGH